jgi:predicted RNase H-like nuclease (RuvC/YqgF family)
MSYDANIREWYQNYLGRAPDQGGYDHYMNRLNQGHNIYEVAADIQNSAEARGRRASQAQQTNNQISGLQGQVSDFQGQISGYQNQISDYKNRIGDYRNQVSGLQNQYNDAMGQVSTWQTKASEFESSARDWQDQFTTKSQEYETARDEAERYRNEAVGQQLRAMKSGATTGGSNSNAQQGGLASGRTQYQQNSDDGIDVDKGIKAESGTLSNKGQVVERMVSGQRRQTSPSGSPNRALASGGGSGYYASRFS